MLVKFDHEGKQVRLCLRGQDILPILQEPEKENPEYAITICYCIVKSYF